MKIKKQNTTKVALFAGATALMALTQNSHAQTSVDALLNKLEQKGILSVDEARELKSENATNEVNDFNTALSSKFPMPDWVTGYKLSGDFRGRYDEVASTAGNAFFTDRTRYRYRLRAGLVVSMKDNLEAGFRITSGDPATSGSFNNAGNPLSNNSTLQDNGTKKGVYIDTAYGKWTPLSGNGWLFSTMIGKMDNPLQFTPMIFDGDWTPEGAAIQTGYTFNDRQAIVVNGAAFVEDQEVGGADTGSMRAPALFAGQAIWNAGWTSHLATSLGIGGYLLNNSENLTSSGAAALNVPYINQGNTRTAGGVLVNGYSPIIADASATYKFDSFPLYPGVFPVKFAAEYVNNVNTVSGGNNQGYWFGVTFGKAGKKHAWDISYRYEYLESDAVYDQLADDDNGAYYQNAPTGGAVGWFSGTNVKGSLIKANYSVTDSLTLTLTCFLNQLINPGLNSPGEPNNQAVHFMADVMWKF